MNIDNVMFSFLIFFAGFYISATAYHLFTFLGSRERKEHLYYVMLLFSLALILVLSVFLRPIFLLKNHNLQQKILIIANFIAPSFSIFAITKFGQMLLPFQEFKNFLKPRLIFFIFLPLAVSIVVYLVTGNNMTAFSFIYIPMISVYGFSYTYKVLRIILNKKKRQQLSYWQRINVYSFTVFTTLYFFTGVINFFFAINFEIFLIINFSFMIQVFLSAYTLAKQFHESNYRLKNLKDNLENTVKERTSQLLEANQKIAKSHEERKTFFINLAHELKTPVTLIGNYLDRFARGTGTPEDFQIIHRNFYKLQRDIVNFLDLEKLTSGQVYYNHKHIVNLKGFLAEKIPLFTGGAVKKDITLTCSCCDLDVWAAIDPLALDRIINNLLENALRYTPEGGTITVKALPEKGRAKLVISDSGIGIARDRLEKIFDPHYQIVNEKRNIQGMGMGLSIVKQIIDDIRGKIEVDSNPGEGTVFTISLPAIKKELANNEAKNNILQEDYSKLVSKPVFSPEEKKIKSPGFDKEKPTLLIIEDTLDMLDWLVDSFKDEYNVFFSKNGKDALKNLKTMPQKPDCIISDVMMDEMDGFTFYKKISTSKNLSDIPFIFVTARLSIPDKIKALSLGAVDFIFKPFPIDELKYKVKSLLSLVDSKITNKKEEFMDKLSQMLDETPSPAVPATPADQKAQSLEKQSKIREFSKREKDIANLIVKGLQNKEIAAKLGITIRTVDSHVYNIFKKAGCSNRTELVAYLIEENSFFPKQSRGY